MFIKIVSFSLTLSHRISRAAQLESQDANSFDAFHVRRRCRENRPNRRRSAFQLPRLYPTACAKIAAAINDLLYRFC